MEVSWWVWDRFLYSLLPKCVVSSATGCYHAVMAGNQGQWQRVCVVLEVSVVTLINSSYWSILRSALNFLFNNSFLLWVSLFTHVEYLSSNSFLKKLYFEIFLITSGFPKAFSDTYWLIHYILPFPTALFPSLINHLVPYNSPYSFKSRVFYHLSNSIFLIGIWDGRLLYSFFIYTSFRGVLPTTPHFPIFLLTTQLKPFHPSSPHLYFFIN